MPDFDTASIYRQYAEAYERCLRIEQNFKALENEPPTTSKGWIERERGKLRREGDKAYLELLGLYHKLSMCASLDVAVARGKLKECGVFRGRWVEECS